MKTDRDSIQTLRLVVLLALRLVSVALVVWGLVLVGNRLLYGVLGNGDVTAAWSSWMSNGEWHGVFLGGSLCVVGGGLGLASGWLAQWIVRPAPRGCPSCGFGEVDGEGRCTECGYR